MGVSEDAVERRKKKRGAIVVEEAERVRDDRWALEEMHKCAQGSLFGGQALPDDDKEQVPGKAGRPLGAQAVAPAAYRRYVLATKGDFLGRLISIANTDTLSLARALGCEPAKALELQMKIASTAAPYVYQAQPRQLEVGDGEYFAGLLFNVGSGGPPAGVEGGRASGLDVLAALAGKPADMQEIQALSAPEFGKSERPQSEQDEETEAKAP